jgi:glycosyltransferase involved in cell wall biosynthesis
MKRKTILIITLGYAPNVGGLETHLDNLVNYLTKNGYKLFVLTYQPIQTKARGKRLEKRDNLEIHRVCWFGRGWLNLLEAYPPFALLYLFPGLFISSFIFLCKNYKHIDVVHAQGFICGVIATLLTKIFKKRTILSTHSVYGFGKNTWTSRFLKRIINSFDMVLCLSEQSKQEIVEMGLDERKVKVYTYWVDQSLFVPLIKEDCKKKMGCDGKMVVLFVGRLVKSKGLHLLIDIAKRLSLLEKNVLFAILGDGLLAEEMEEVARREKNIVFLGKVNNSELGAYYSAADVFIVPSTSTMEGFPRVVIEALSCSIPVVASAIGCLPETIDSSVGLLCDPSVEDFVEKVLYCYEKPEELERMTKNSREYAIRRYGEKNAGVIESSYYE